MITLAGVAPGMEGRRKLSRGIGLVPPDLVMVRTAKGNPPVAAAKATRLRTPCSTE